MPDRDYSHRLLIDKLGIKPGHRVAVIDVDDGVFWGQLRERGAEVVDEANLADCDAIVYRAEDEFEMMRLDHLKHRIKPNGMIWVVNPKGRREFKDTDVMRGGLAVGLVDVKTCSFSAELSATKFVFRVKDRPRP